MKTQWWRRTLVLAPHPDDELLGVGGLMARLAAESHDVRVSTAYCPRVFQEHIGRTVGLDERQRELRAACAALGLKREPDAVRFSEAPDLHSIPIRDIVRWLDALIADTRPTALLIPLPSHHQDHRALYNAARSAIRMRPATATIGLVACYEYPYTIAADRSGSRLIANISGEPFERKLRALACYASQLRANSPTQPLSERSVRLLAEWRGAEVGVESGEALYPIRASV